MGVGLQPPGGGTTFEYDVGGVRMASPKKTDPGLVSLISDLKKASRENDAPIWRDIAKRLEKPSRVWAEVNISRLALHTEKGETLIIPGKLLGAGEIDYPVTVAAFKASRGAADKITAAGGSVLSISQLIQSNPKGKGVRIMG
ncbi:MAG: 50S ribosomal protein L18e [Thermoplasmatota archaeon]